MARDMAGLPVVITGASSGIGRAAARLFAQRGACLTLAARRAEPIEEVARECRNLSREAVALPTDVTQAEAVAELAEEALHAQC